MFLEGDTAHEALLLLNGLVKISVAAIDGKEVILDVLGDGSLVGELSAVDGHARSTTATALGPCGMDRVVPGGCREGIAQST